MTSSYFGFEQELRARKDQYLAEADAERLASLLPGQPRGVRRRMAAALYALASWLNDGALEVSVRRSWKLPPACADWCNGVEYWCAFPPPLVH